MALVKTKGLVIRERPFQEQDKILTLFTEEQGKLQAIAKGVRRSKSSIIAATQLFAYSEFVYYPGKNFASINQADLVEAYYPLRSNLVKMSLASYLLELIDVFYDWYQGNRAVFRLLTFILYYIAYSKASNDEALAAAFQLKLCEVNGIFPVLDQCANCHRKEEPVRFSIENSGVLCHNCQSIKGYKYTVDSELCNMMDWLTRTPVKAVREKEYDKEQISRIVKIMNHYISYHLDVKLKTYDFYESIQ